MQMTRSIVVALGVLLLACDRAAAQEVIVQHEDAIVWTQEQMAKGRVEGGTGAGGVLYVGEEVLASTIEDGAFAVPVRLDEGVTPLVACMDDEVVCSDMLRYELGSVPRPEAEVYAKVEGRQVTLRGRVVENPDAGVLLHTWTQDSDNPASVTLNVTSDSVATFSLLSEASSGAAYCTPAQAARMPHAIRRLVSDPPPH